MAGPRGSSAWRQGRGRRIPDRVGLAGLDQVTRGQEHDDPRRRVERLEPAGFPLRNGPDQSRGYSIEGVCTNQAESFYSRLRRAELVHHYHLSGAYLINYAKEWAWRENNRRVSNGDQARRVMTLAMASKPSVDLAGYWQRSASS